MALCALRFGGPATKRRPQRGFTLIELMITVVVLGIITAIAVPNYFEYVRRSRIIDATTKLGDMRSQMEKFFMDNRTYLNGAACGIDAAPLNIVAAHNADPARQFNFTCPAGAVTALTYVLQADGIVAKGMGGFRFTIDQANAKRTVTLPAGWAGTGNPCWVIKKDGTC